MIQGMIYSVVAGVMIVFQSVFNARLSERIGLWHSNAFVHGSGMLLALVILLLVKRSIDFSKLGEIPPYYLLGGVFGVIIIFSVMQGVTGLGASYAITIIVVTQILVSYFINNFGIFGEQVIKASPDKIFGLVLMIIGLIIYQL
ncbi:MAG: DMT family transporter [Halanaerobiales bacterium]